MAVVSPAAPPPDDHDIVDVGRLLFLLDLQDLLQRRIVRIREGRAIDEDRRDNALALVDLLDLPRGPVELIDVDELIMDVVIVEIGFGPAAIGAPVGAVEKHPAEGVDPEDAR